MFAQDISDPCQRQVKTRLRRAALPAALVSQAGVWKRVWNPLLRLPAVNVGRLGGAQRNKSAAWPNGQRVDYDKNRLADLRTEELGGEHAIVEPGNR